MFCITTNKVAKLSPINEFILRPLLYSNVGLLANKKLMVVFEKFRPLFWWIVAIAALNWGLVAFMDVNLVTDIVQLTTEQSDYVYGAIGIVALINMYNMAHEM